MARGWFLYETSAADTMELAVTGVGANTHAQAAPPYNVQRPAIADAWTSAEIANSGTITLSFSLPQGLGAITMDTIAIPGFHVLGPDIEDQDRPRSLLRRPTGMLSLGGITPEAPNDDGTAFFKPEKILSRAIGTNFQQVVIDTWRGAAALTFPKAARSSLVVNLAINAGATFRVVIPRVMIGVRYTPRRNFQDSPNIELVDPVQLGRRQGAFIAEGRKNPYRRMALRYENIDSDDLEEFENLFQSAGKTVPFVAMPNPARVGTMAYCRFLDSPVNWDLYDEEGDVDYNSITVNLSEVSRA